ncbi:MAG: pre-peptidase C-terminal domain-containing protein, partial [Candidatus Thermoplasmatota archaeon]|nr:pre-peptidase C-terminal domain-containing protein [Candidatus Thermoplasmatota archaeon]
MKRTMIIILVLTALLPAVSSVHASSVFLEKSRADDDVMSNATVIALNDSAYDTIHNETDFWDWYKVEVTAGDIIIINLTVPVTGNFDLTVYNANSELVTKSWTYRVGGFEETIFMANMSNYYYIQVSTFEGNGSYTLQVLKDSEYVHDGNDYRYSATEIIELVTINEKHDMIEGIDDDDYYTIFLGENDRLSASLSYQPGQNFDLFCLAPDGTVLNESTNFTGSEEVTVTVDDEGWYYVQASVIWGSGDYYLSIIVVRGNAPPLITDTVPEGTTFTVEEGQWVIFSVNVNDPENDILGYIWRVDNVLVTGENTKEFNLSTTYNDSYSAGNYQVEVSVEDGYNSVSHDWNLVVEDRNPSPVMTIKWPAGDEVTINENENVLFITEIEDPDGTIPLIAWSVNKVSQAEETGVSFNFRADYKMAGIYKVEIEVMDSLDPVIKITKIWTVTVTDVDRKPIVTDIIPIVAGQTDEKTSLEFSFNFTNPDSDTVTYWWYFDGELMAGEKMSRYEFTPTYSSYDGKKHTIRVEATVGTHELNHSWELTITDVNRLPVIDNTTQEPKSGLKFTEDKKIAFSAEVVDPDGDNITYSWVNIATGEEISTI